MKKRTTLFSATGIPSLFLIFSVLILVILSLLGYGTSRQNLRSSTLSLEQTTAYYESCGKVTDFYNQTLKDLKEFQDQAKDQNYYFRLVGSYFRQKENTSWDEVSHQVQYTQAFSDTQSLLATFQVLYSDQPDLSETVSANADILSILTWNTIVTADWNPDTSQSVYKGE